MRFPAMPSSLRLLLSLTTSLFALTQAAPSLNITALTHRDNLSILQCWRLEPPFSTPTSGSGPTGAAVASLGAVAGNASFIVQAPGSAGGYRNAPAPQWSWFISGLGHITTSNGEVWVAGGRYGLVWADDTKDVSPDGHTTTFPSGDETVLLGLPWDTSKGKIQPDHEVLHDGACGFGELSGI